MSTVANTPRNSGPTGATAFIAAVVMSSLAMVVEAALQRNAWHLWQFSGLVLAATLTARLKVKLPGVNSNMSVSLPFLLIVMTRLSLPEMLLTAAVSVFTQSVPKAPHRFSPLQAMFNVSTGVLATGLGWEVFHRAATAHANSTACLLLGCLAYLVASTGPVAGIIALTEHHGLVRTWSEIVHLSFPYYVASTGVASMALSLQGDTTWSLLVGVSLVAVVMYHSYRRYFAVSTTADSVTTAPQPLKAKSASAV